jgi:hypothetical protein
MDKIEPRLIGIVDNITRCVQIKGHTTAAVFLEYLKSIENHQMYDAFLDNLSKMIVSDFNQMYYVQMTKKQFIDCMSDFFDQFSTWHKLPFIDLSPTDMKGISISDLTKKTVAQNPLLILRDKILEQGYRYLPAYYALKQYDQIPYRLKPYQTLFVKRYIGISGQKGMESGNFQKYLERQVPYIDIDPTSTTRNPDKIESTLQPKIKNQFDESFERVASSISNISASKDKNAISEILASDYSKIDLPNFMPPKEMILLFWSYIGELSVKANVTGLWVE